MKKIYKITPEVQAPELTIFGINEEILVGESLIGLSSEKSFEGSVNQLSEWNQFYRVGNDAFAITEEAWENCMDMYYTIIENDVELLSVVANGQDFRVIHPRQFLPSSNSPDEICDLTYVNALFRIENRLPREVFCFEGMSVQGNEFKYNYDQFSFKGLSFEEVWSEDGKLV